MVGPATVRRIENDRFRRGRVEDGVSGSRTDVVEGALLALEPPAVPDGSLPATAT